MLAKHTPALQREDEDPSVTIEDQSTVALEANEAFLVSSARSLLRGARRVESNRRAFPQRGCLAQVHRQAVRTGCRERDPLVGETRRVGCPFELPGELVPGNAVVRAADERGPVQLRQPRSETTSRRDLWKVDVRTTSCDRSGTPVERLSTPERVTGQLE